MAAKAKTIIRVNQQSTEREKKFQNLLIRQRASIQNLQRTKADLQEKNKQTHPKVGKRYEQTFSKRRHM